MSDLEQLKSILRATARDGLSAGRDIGFDGAEAGLGLILAQIDTAALARRLTFRFEDGTDLTFEAASRRLTRLIGPPPDGLAPGSTRLFDGGELGPDQAQAVADALLATCQGKGRMTISSRAIGGAPGPTEGGVSPIAIARCLGLPPLHGPEDSALDTIDTLIEALVPVLTTAILIEGDGVTLISGDEIEATELSDWAVAVVETLLSPAFPLAATLETDGMMVFALPEAAGMHVLIAGRLGQLLVAACAGSDTAATMELWRHARD